MVGERHCSSYKRCIINAAISSKGSFSSSESKNSDTTVLEKQWTRFFIGANSHASFRDIYQPRGPWRRRLHCQQAAGPVEHVSQPCERLPPPCRRAKPAAPAYRDRYLPVHSRRRAARLNQPIDSTYRPASNVAEAIP